MEPIPIGGGIYPSMWILPIRYEDTPSGKLLVQWWEWLAPFSATDQGKWISVTKFPEEN